MFEPSDKPRVFALPPGADFPRALVTGLTNQFRTHPPEALARVELIVNTRRMARRIRALFDDGPALLLPRIRLVTDLSDHVALDTLPPPVPALKRRLELVRLVSGFLDAEPGFAPRAALFDLADSLAALLGEMQGEGVPPAALDALNIEDQSGHWARTRDFVSIVQRYFDDTGEPPDTEARQRLIVQALADRWAEAAPDHPVIIAGSTGSRGTTQVLMQAVARLPQGAIVLPGFDFHMPPDLWAALDDPLLSEDHPQYRFHALMRALDIGRHDIRPWGDAAEPSPARNALVSLALRPAPVTDQWLAEGPRLTNLAQATGDMTLIEAPTLRAEAMAIALRLRQAAEDGEAAALITPDRVLTRQVAAALDRWNILPDDSAGQPLPLSPIGRLLRHIGDLFATPLTTDMLLTLLKHPLVHSADDRGDHNRLTHELELFVRRKGVPFPDAGTLTEWVEKTGSDTAKLWSGWIAQTFMDQHDPGDRPLADRLQTHLDLLVLAMRGADKAAIAHPWDHADGHEAKRILEDLTEAAPEGGALSARDYGDLFLSVLAGGEVREVDTPHPHILIWGTLEARVQGADLLILAGLNEGSWPEPPSPDPWLNRMMRNQIGLLLPERRIGLSAHDFQQAIAAPSVWLTRSLKSDEAETVSSRWLSRLTNLLGGLPDQGGDAALEDMRKRGRHWLALAAEMERPGQTPPAPRPAPRPPVAARPRALSVTEIKRLIRDPYAIYAKHVLKLRPLDPLMRLPDALIRGIVTHSVMEEFIRDTADTPEARTRERLLETAAQVFERDIPWPAARLLWLARLEKVVDGFLADEAQRRALADPVKFEVKGHRDITELGFILRGTADRIDRTETGGYAIYDYKTGKPPTPAQQESFDKQLLLEAAIADAGGFADLPRGHVETAAFIGLGASSGQVAAPLEDNPPAKVWAELTRLVASYLEPDQGFQARRAMFQTSEASDYDQLARFGEWDITQRPVPEDLT